MRLLLPDAGFQHLALHALHVAKDAVRHLRREVEVWIRLLV
jgi:hypothetical protein